MDQPQDILQPTLRHYLDKLKAQAEATSDWALEPIKPPSLIDQYQERITSWVHTMTALQKQRAYTLQEVIQLAGLKGHYRAQASIQMTGEALRRCGFSPKRDWSNLGRNKRYWKLIKEEMK